MKGGPDVCGEFITDSIRKLECKPKSTIFSGIHSALLYFTDRHLAQVVSKLAAAAGVA